MRCRIGGVAEGAVEAGCVFGGIGHNNRIDEAFFVQGLTDGCDAAVHHIRRGDDIGTGFGLADGDFVEQLQRRVVIDVVVFDLTAVAVVRVLAEADVADDDHVRQGFLDGADGTLDRALRVPGAGADFVFISRQAKDFDSPQSQGIDVFGQAYGVVYGQVITAGHAGDFFFDIRAGDDEDRINQIVETYMVFPDHNAQGSRKAQAAGA